MRYIDRVIFSFILLSLLGFSYVTMESDEVKDTQKFEKSQNLSENTVLKSIPIITYEPMTDMVASWYGEQFHGNSTANGEIFDQYEMTAAHKTLKFGTLLRITNPANNRSIIVRINDRGPYIEGRDLDLSYAAAKALNLTRPGVKKVKVEVVNVNDSIEVLNTINSM
ncbi:MAG: septal ring lytic transglycosylase RlpA family protein [Ignavibacteria bacterium]|nr:septal ring lytic transglycosylase RlpA family protein [Ignavibacteria bacterium]